MQTVIAYQLLGRMKTLADMVLDYYWFINFSSDEELDADIGVKLIEHATYQIANELSKAERGELNYCCGTNS